ncbi:structural protein [Bacillus safensis]|uniref:Uncharacterized protein n=1 Tax=Bacillus safensis TaxID=561879 RepID=A0A5C0WL52_BACIA|nr:structural protein [Bacillus safensis]MDI0189462.1 structural protein [Bacillus safensis]MEC1412758.1 structural protein [Bacillus safensis]QEK65389.1 hypothetical protein FX981_03659 [Bacillus safensis]
MASAFGVSANPTKANHKIGEDKVVRIAVQNHNDFSAGPNLIPQRKVNGKWETIKTNSPPLTQVKNFMINLTSKSHLVTKKVLIALEWM